MKNDIDAQFLCKDCSRYNQCRYYHNRKEDSYICKYFEFHLAVPDNCMGCEYKEQEPCEDAVSREDALDILEDYDYDRDRHKENAFADARARMVALPSVTPIRPKGEWIDFAVEPEKIFNQHYYACPHCDHGATYFVGGTENWWCTETPNFCPHCGADMRGEKDKGVEE